MRKTLITTVLAGALAAVPLVGFGATVAKVHARPIAGHTAQKTAAMHAARGIVKSVDATTLVITRKGKKRGDMTFALNPSTHREGSVEVGIPVSVRYREEGKTYVATAIAAEHVKQQAAHRAPSAR